MDENKQGTPSNQDVFQAFIDAVNNPEDKEVRGVYDRVASVREKILYEGAKITSGARNSTYGPPVPNMQDIARMWQTYLSQKMLNNEGSLVLRGEDVAHMMTLMKIARTLQPMMHADNYLDGAVYQAIAGECAMEERCAGGPG